MWQSGLVKFYIRAGREAIGRDRWWTPLRYAWDEFTTFNLGQL